MSHHDHHGEHAHHGPNVNAYIAVFVALCAFTVVSFVVNYFTRMEYLSPMVGFVLILAAACCKAFLVCAIFMHLKWDWNRLYFMIVPAFILAPFLVFALLPDLVLYWKNFYASPAAGAVVDVSAHKSGH